MPTGSDELAPYIFQLLTEVTQVQIKVGDNSFSLCEVSLKKRLNELEFDFNVPLFNPADLLALQTPETQLSLRYTHQLEGIINGKMDMFFEHSGLYYLLDWKSNFLGDTTDFYQSEGLQTAMNENNYHLQYLIYTVAATKFLQSRLPTFNYETQFGGVVYVFVRGVRVGQQTGIFTVRPTHFQVQKLGELLSQAVAV